MKGLCQGPSLGQVSSGWTGLGSVTPLTLRAAESEGPRRVRGCSQPHWMKGRPASLTRMKEGEDQPA